MAEAKVQTDREIVRMPTRSTTHLVDTAAVADGVIECVRERLGHEEDGVDEVALAGPVR